VFASDLPGEVDELILERPGRAARAIRAVWGATLPYAPRIVLFGDYGAWLEWRTADRSTSRTEVVVGQTFDAWGVIAQVLTGFPSEPAYRELAYSTVLHEMEHLYQAEFLSGRGSGCARQVYEGDAKRFSRSTVVRLPWPKSGRWRRRETCRAAGRAS